MKAKITIRVGRHVLMSGTLEAFESDYERADRGIGSSTFGRFCEDLFAIEQAINADGRLRCHIELEGEPAHAR